MDQLLLGTLMFTVLVFLWPTTFMYYLFLTKATLISLAIILARPAQALSRQCSILVAGTFELAWAASVCRFPAHVLEQFPYRVSPAIDH
jgi:hypothetical protein